MKLLGLIHRSTGQIASALSETFGLGAKIRLGIFTGWLGIRLVWADTQSPEETKLDRPDAQRARVSPLPAHPRTARIVMEQLRRNHFVDLDVDDNLSSQTFDNYIEALDPARYYFLASDIAEFEAYRYDLDNALKRGDLLPAFRMFNRLQQRYGPHRLRAEEINQGLERLDFSTDQMTQIEREDAAWPASCLSKTSFDRRLFLKS